jgi:hypothetical protein
MSLNQHYMKLDTKPGEPVRKFIERYKLANETRCPSIWEMTNYYSQYVELAMWDAYDLREALIWCADNLAHDDWFCTNIYFFFTNDTDAAMFRLAYCGDPVEKV